jgi:hypothetical protein
MEAVNVSQHRTKVNLSAGSLTWVSAPSSITPNFRLWSRSIRGGRGEKLPNLTPRDLLRSERLKPFQSFGKACEGNDNRLMSRKKSDHLIVVLKPSNAGGAKGMTS